MQRSAFGISSASMTSKQLQRAVRDLPNVLDFCRRHKLPLRTLMRIKAGGEPRAGTAKLIEIALDADRVAA